MPSFERAISGSSSSSRRAVAKTGLVSAPPCVGRGAPRHQRIENIRALSGAGTRDTMPSRSVRFIEEEESGRPGNPSRSSARGDDEVESTPRSRVGVDGGGVGAGTRNGANAGGNKTLVLSFLHRSFELDGIEVAKRRETMLKSVSDKGHVGDVPQ